LLDNGLCVYPYTPILNKQTKYGQVIMGMSKHFWHFW